MRPRNKGLGTGGLAIEASRSGPRNRGLSQQMESLVMKPLIPKTLTAVSVLALALAVGGCGFLDSDDDDDMMDGDMATMTPDEEEEPMVKKPAPMPDEEEEPMVKKPAPMPDEEEEPMEMAKPAPMPDEEEEPMEMAKPAPMPDEEEEPMEMEESGPTPADIAMAIVIDPDNPAGLMGDGRPSGMAFDGSELSQTVATDYEPEFDMAAADALGKFAASVGTRTYLSGGDPVSDTVYLSPGRAASHRMMPSTPCGIQAHLQEMESPALLMEC